jgi:DNA-directed RNA polymerase
MPNLVHSLDASNIHLLCNNLTTQPLYTIHDCFATTANNMTTIENQVKNAFLNIYFNEGNYIEKMHKSILEQINSYTTIFSKSDRNNYVTIDKKEYLIPNLPTPFTEPKLVEVFVNGIKKSKFFIS